MDLYGRALDRPLVEMEAPSDLVHQSQIAA
jgi:hypothetical protein